MKCIICGLYSGENKLCFKHAAAARSIAENYSIWQKAFNISFDEYLKRILENRETGTWVAEVAKYIIESGDTSILNL